MAIEKAASPGKPCGHGSFTGAALTFWICFPALSHWAHPLRCWGQLRPSWITLQGSLKRNDYFSAQNPIATLTDYSPHLSLPRKITWLPSLPCTLCPSGKTASQSSLFQKSLFSTGYHAGRATRNYCLYYFQSIRNSMRDFFLTGSNRELNLHSGKNTPTLVSFFSPLAPSTDLTADCTYLQSATHTGHALSSINNNFKVNSSRD